MANIFKIIFMQLVNYIKEKCWEQLKQVFLQAFETFKLTLWEEIKHEVQALAQQVISDVESYCKSEEVKVKEEVILNKVIENLKLPLVLRPFKGLVKKLLKSKIEALVVDLINKAKEFVA